MQTRPTTAACAELKVRTVHRDDAEGLNKPHINQYNSLSYNSVYIRCKKRV
jgi:hypothetical protein